MEQIRGWMEKYGLKAKSLHASKGSARAEGCERVRGHYRKDYTSQLEPNRIAGVEVPYALGQPARYPLSNSGKTSDSCIYSILIDILTHSKKKAMGWDVFCWRWSGMALSQEMM